MCSLFHLDTMLKFLQNTLIVDAIERPKTLDQFQYLELQAVRRKCQHPVLLDCGAFNLS